MKEFVISEAQVETAVLVGLITKTQDERKTNEYLDELAFLAETAGAEVVKRFTQKLDQANSVTYVGKGKLEEIKEYITSTFGYNLNRSIEEIRPSYYIDARATCQGSVPEAIISFLDSTDYENAIRLAISIGGDSDTIACMTGGIAEAYYKKIPDEIVNTVMDMLPQQMIEVIEEFSTRYL